LLSRMDGGDNAENAEILQALMENAAKAHDDNPEESWATHLAYKQKILARIQEKSLAAIA
ncbi:MAG: hypothetical protein NT026_00685, partial [Candidatus Staskawiczbacteria bacterium]|nr:hypothetical protein [Candidatus Staskawiczbacteria bacterium]